MYQLYFYVPPEKLDDLLDALFAAGAGSYGAYDRCCWVTEGHGQFRPLANSQPHLGKQGEVMRVKELKVEMICTDTNIAKVVAALKEHHPYEQPAYGVIKLHMTKP